MLSDSGLISVRNLSKQEIASFFSSVSQIPSQKRSSTGLLAFFEKSSRTRSSFEAAGLDLGMRWLSFDPNESSFQKGESLRDGFALFSVYPVEFSVVRHPLPGICFWISQWTRKPVINAGEGACEHPTQALGDAYSLYQKSKSKKWKICFFGDLTKSRVARSSLVLFKKCGWSVSICDDAQESTRLFATAFELPLVPRSHLKKMDVVYVLRAQKERGGSSALGPLLIEDVQETTKLMHAGPVIWGEDLAFDFQWRADQLLISDQVRACFEVRRKILSELSRGRSR